MKTVSLDQNWTFRWGYLDSVGGLDNDPGQIVNLPHDAMIGTKVTADCSAGCDSGFFNGGICNYTKFLFVPEDWKNQKIGLKFDGAMMNASVDINGCKVAHQNFYLCRRQFPRNRISFYQSKKSKSSRSLVLMQ